MELTIREYAEKHGKKKPYLSRIVRENKVHLLKDVEKISQKKDAFGTLFYTLKMKPTNRSR